MKRREFIRNSILGTGALLFTPIKLTGSFKGKVIIVGAGASGLHAAWLLNKQGIDVTILEASDVWGGRIRANDNFSEIPVELGAEKIYGKRSFLYDLAKKANAQFSSLKGETYYSLDGFVNTEAQLEDDTEFKMVLAIREAIGEYSGPDMSLEKFAIRQGLSKRVLPVFNALTGNCNGASISQIGINGFLGINGKDDGHVLIGRSMLSLLEEKYVQVKEKVKFNTVVSSIDYYKESIKVKDKTGTVYTADKVIVTVPVTVLKSDDIKFLPALREDKLQAFSKIGMGPGMKILLKFNKRFWKDDATSIIGTGYVPEFVVTGFGRSNMLTASVNGEGAAFLSELGNSASTEVVKELDKIFGGNVASRTLANTYIMDWFKHPYIRGSYSFPTLNSTGSPREVISRSVDGKLFFAGEAMNTGGHFGTVHGAIETAQSAVEELLKS
jgi:monoamine oxidase